MASGRLGLPQIGRDVITRSALADVKHLYYAIGSAYPEKPAPGATQLTEGWARELLKNGTLTLGTKSIDTGKGVWTKANEPRIDYNAKHNNHIHIALDFTLLEK